MAKTIDLYEYPNNAIAQAAYPSSSGYIPLISQTVHNTYWDIGDRGDIEFDTAQSFTLSETTKIFGVAIRFGVEDGGNGNVTFRIETDSAGKPSGNLAHANATKTILNPTVASWVDYIFANPFSLNAGLYWIVSAHDAQSLNNRWRWRTQSTDVYANGNMSTYNHSTGIWTDFPTQDCAFKLYGDKLLQCYSENTIVQQGTRSLKVEAAQTGSLNETLTKTLTGGDKIDLSGYVKLIIWVYASRTGTNIEVKIHDSGGTTTTISIIITSSNTWTKITKDISAVADADKDDIDEIKIEIIEAGAVNTFYVDNFYGIEIVAYPVSRLNKNRITGYHCFMDQYMRAKREGLRPLKLPDGTVW